MALHDPSRIAAPKTYADLKAEAERLFPDDYKPTGPGLGSMGKYTPEQLRAAHRAVHMTPAIRAELDAEIRAEFGPLWKDVNPRSAL